MQNFTNNGNLSDIGGLCEFARPRGLFRSLVLTDSGPGAPGHKVVTLRTTLIRGYKARLELWLHGVPQAVCNTRR